MLFIDHQAAIMTDIGDIDPVRFRNNVIALAKIAKLHKLPTVLSDNMPEGFAGPILPELVKLLPDAPLIHRAGPINAWDDPAFVMAIEATRRRKLVIAGCTTDICLMFPALSALQAGYDVYGVIDASGTWSPARPTNCAFAFDSRWRRRYEHRQCFHGTAVQPSATDRRSQRAIVRRPCSCALLHRDATPISTAPFTPNY
jgi:nicotinamidase-related amidase